LGLPITSSDWKESHSHWNHPRKDLEDSHLTTPELKLLKKEEDENKTDIIIISSTKFSVWVRVATRDERQIKGSSFTKTSLPLHTHLFKTTYNFIMTLLEEIRANDVVIDLNLANIPEDYFEETKDMIAALRENTSIETVRFDEDFIACVYGRERGQLLAQVAQLPNLKEVFLGDALLAADVIADLVKSAKGLRKLTLQRIVIQGVQSDLDHLISMINKHISLKDFQMDECIAACEGVDLEGVLNAGTNFKPSIIENPTREAKVAIAG
jgi:hypothetical protein